MKDSRRGGNRSVKMHILHTSKTLESNICSAEIAKNGHI